MGTKRLPPCPNDEESKALVKKLIEPSHWFPFVRISILKDLKESASARELRERAGSGSDPQTSAQNVPRNIPETIPQNIPKKTSQNISRNIPRNSINNSPGPGVPCHLCPRRLKNEGAWIAHLKSHQNEVPEPFACTLCPEAFDDHNEFKYHLVTSHPKDYVLFDNPRFTKAVTIRKIKQACPTCLQTFASHSDLTLHLTTHQNHKPVPGPSEPAQAPIPQPATIRPFKCSLCHLDFDSEKSLSKHSREFHKNLKEKVQKSCICPICGYDAKRPPLLARHNRIHKGEKPSNFKCGTCRRRFWWENNLKVHAKTCTGVNTQLIRRDNLTRQMYKCSKCNYTCKTRWDRDRHEKLHGDKFMCELCPTGFSGQFGLYTHKRKEHPNDKNKFICTECGKGFPAKDAVRKHKQEDHPEKSCICLFCGYDAKKPNQLARHNRIHTGEKPFTCDTCGYKFTRKSNLEDHVERCAGVNTQVIKKDIFTRQMYKCSKCNYKSRGRVDRDRHEKLHGDKFMCELCPTGFSGPFGLSMHRSREHPNDPNKFICTECGKGFPAKEAIRKHKQVDHQIFKKSQTSYICLVCGYNAKKPNQLAKHHRVHTREMPFTCDTCGSKFRWECNMKVHVKNCTGTQIIKRDNFPRQMYKCSKCNYKCGARMNRDRHEKLHGDKFMCELCPTGFSGPFGLSMHKRKEHPNDKNKFTCAECGKGFPAKEAVRKHRRVDHGIFKICPNPVGFKHTYGLAMHNRVEHPGLKRTAKDNGRNATPTKSQLDYVPKEEPGAIEHSDDSAIRVKIEGPSTSEIKLDQDEHEFDST